MTQIQAHDPKTRSRRFLVLVLNDAANMAASTLKCRVVIATSAVRTQKAPHSIKKKNSNKKETFLDKRLFQGKESEGDSNNPVNDLWLSDRVLESNH